MQPNRQPNASHAAQVQHVCIFPPFNMPQTLATPHLKRVKSTPDTIYQWRAQDPLAIVDLSKQAIPDAVLGTHQRSICSMQLHARNPWCFSNSTALAQSTSTANRGSAAMRRWVRGSCQEGSCSIKLTALCLQPLETPKEGNDACHRLANNTGPAIPAVPLGQEPYVRPAATSGTHTTPLTHSQSAVLHKQDLTQMPQQTTDAQPLGPSTT